MTVELLTQSEDSPDKLLIRMRVHDQVKKNGEEAIEFPYDLKMDKVEEVVEEMVREGEREGGREGCGGLRDNENEGRSIVGSASCWANM